jgi:PKD repeat protein
MMFSPLSFSPAMVLRLTAAIIIILFAANVTIANAQQQQGLLQLLQLLTSQPATVENGTAETAATTFQSTNDGFRVQVPQGWVIQDINNTESVLSEEETTQGFEVLARLCPDEEELQQQQQAAAAAAAAAATLSTTNSTTADWLTSELNVGGQTYPIQYMIDGGSINNMTISNETKSLIVLINSTDVGTLDIRLPRNVIDAKTDEGSDAEFAAIIDDAEFIEPGEPTTAADMRTLSISFPSGAEKIEILGTSAATLSTTNASVGSSSTATSTNSTTTTSSCQGAQEELIHIIRYPDLEAAIQEDNNVTTYHLQKLQEVGYRDIQTANSTDMTVNLANVQTNETIALLPAKFVEMTYSTTSAPNEIRRGYFILTATAATEPDVGTAKGYSVLYEGSSTNTTTTAEAETTTSSSLPPSLLPPAVGQVFDSFELIAAPEVAQASAAEEEEEEEDEGAGAVAVGEPKQAKEKEPSPAAEEKEPADVLTVEIISNSMKGVVPADFEFDTLITGGTEPYTISWDFGDGGEESNGESGLLTFNEAGTYTIAVSATDSSGQTASDNIEVTVEEPPTEGSNQPDLDEPDNNSGSDNLLNLYDSGSNLSQNLN